VLGQRERSPTLSPPPNYRRRLNSGGLESGQDERRGEDLCAGYSGKGVSMNNCPLDHIGEDEYQRRGNADELRSRGDNEQGGEDECGDRGNADELRRGVGRATEVPLL
jgi:hypothetical protein